MYFVGEERSALWLWAPSQAAVTDLGALGAERALPVCPVAARTLGRDEAGCDRPSSGFLPRGDRINSAPVDGSRESHVPGI